MKKTILLILGIILCTTIAYADKIDIYSFKVYSDGKRQDVGWSDTEFEMYTGTTMEVQIRFENNWNETIEVDIEGTLFEIGDDIERDKSIDIDEDEKKTVVFEYFIPADTREDIYELEIKYDYDAQEGNQTLHYEQEKKFEIDVREKITPQEDILINITRHLAEEKTRTNDLLETVIDVSNISLAYGKCMDELSNEKISGEYKSKYEAELNKSRDADTKFTECNAQKQNMYSQSQIDSKVNEVESKAKREQKKIDDNFLMVVIAGGGFYLWSKKKKEKVGGKGEGVSLHGAKW